MNVSAHVVDARLELPRRRVAVGRSVRAVAGFDEDVITLAAGSGADLADAYAPQALIVATTSPPLAEGGTAPLLIEIFKMHDALVVEQGGTIAAGGSALLVAMTLVHAGIEPVLVIGADHRLDPDGRPMGAGAVAFVLASEGSGGILRHLGSSSGWFPDTWRPAAAPRVSFGDRSFGNYSAGSQFAAAHAANALVGATGPSLDRAGALGSASLGAHLLLEAPRKNASRRFAVSAGGLNHAFELSGGPNTTQLRNAALAVQSGGTDGPLPKPVDLDEFNPYASEPRSWRELGQDLRLEGVRDQETGEVFYPQIPSASGRPLEPFPMARRGTVVTHTRDHVYPLGGPLSMVVVDLDGGGRFFGQSTQDDPFEIGMRVRLVIRKLHTGGGFPHYFWKVEPEVL
jgi:uncharacterized OB-fold protein